MASAWFIVLEIWDCPCGQANKPANYNKSMKTQVAIEPLPNGDGFRVTGTGLFAVSAQGRTRDEALRNFQQAATAVLSPATEITEIEVAAPVPHPLASFAGIYATEPLYDEWQAEMLRNREAEGRF